MKKFISGRMGFFWLAAGLLWFKIYIIYMAEFNLDLLNVIQHILLFFNPLSSVLIFLGIALFAKGRRSGIYIIILDLFLSIILYANVVYYRFNSDFITLPTLIQTDNFGSLGESILNLVAVHDMFYTLDIILLIILFHKTKARWSARHTSFRKPMLVITAGIIAFAVNLGIAELDRPQLLKRTFDRSYIVKYLGAYNFMIYDAVKSIESSTQRIIANRNDISDVKNYTKEKYAEPDSEYFGKGKGKNIIKVHLESLQSFMVDYKLHNEQVMPFLHSLAAEENKQFTYFDNFFHQTEQGKTADAELIMDNSLYGLPQGAAFVTKGNNTYQSLPAILRQQEGYTSAVFHGDDKTFWNREEIYKEMGVEHFYDASYYDMRDEHVINYGLKDKPYFDESIPMLQELQEPFYVHMITLTNHHPYLMDEEDASIDPAETGDGSVDRYFQTARYLDEALEQFFADLKDAGLYEDSIILLYGDHYGISDNHNRAMQRITGDEEITPLKNAELQRVPFLIRVPGVDGEGVNHTYSGQMDVMPALMHIAGIKAEDYIQFGTDLFSADHKDFVPFRNGDFVTEKFSQINGVYYDNDTKDVIEPPTEEMERISKTVYKELELSDDVLYGDLLRFYTPNDHWEPINPDDYSYGKEEQNG